MMAVEGEENFVDFVKEIVIDQENVNVDFVDGKMIMHDGKEKSVNSVH